MKISKRQLKRIIREEYSRLKRRGLIKEGSWSDDSIEDAYMCVSETAELEPGSKQIVEDLFYVCDGFYPLQDCVMTGFADEYEDWEEMLEDYVDRSTGVSEATAEGWKQFLMELNSIDPSCGNGLAASFSKFWERNYIGKKNMSINEAAGASQPQDDFQELAYQLLQAGGEYARDVGWLLTTKDFEFRHVIVNMGLGTTVSPSDDNPFPGREGLTTDIPGREHGGKLNVQTRKPIGVSRGEHFAEFPDVAIEFLQNAQASNPRAYADLEKQFFITCNKWGMI